MKKNMKKKERTKGHSSISGMKREDYGRFCFQSSRSQVDIPE